MKLATRLFLSMSLLVAAAVAGSIIAADAVLRRDLEAETAATLEAEARLVAGFLPADSTRWPELAHTAGQQLGRRVTLIDSTGRVRGDADFDRAALAGLENHAGRPEVRAALETRASCTSRCAAALPASPSYGCRRRSPESTRASIPCNWRP